MTVSKPASRKTVHSRAAAAAASAAGQIAAEHSRARQFTEVTFALAALAALAFAALFHHTAFGLLVTEDARSVITWSFVGLAALDAALLLIWQWLMHRIAGSGMD